MSVPTPDGKTTVLTLQQKKARGERITMLTAYDYPTARALDAAGVDALLVGDSLAMVVLGHETTLSVTMEEMLHHARAVARGARRALLVGDLPFMSYQADVADAVRNAGRFLKESGMDAVKLEGGREHADTVGAIVRAGIPVMGHVGLQPQSVRRLGGFRAQARTAPEALSLVDDALALEQAGCFALVVESVPARVATLVSERLRVPTIGIGAGGGTDGQVLVTHDVLGLSERVPRFARRYASLGEETARAAGAFRRDVETGAFPAPDESFPIADEEWGALVAALSPARARNA
jgi:3-methyl-2-oxobutanoate hydroxymethyltransferase